jgi:hypothetical protein
VLELEVLEDVRAHHGIERAGRELGPLRERRLIIRNGKALARELANGIPESPDSGTIVENRPEHDAEIGERIEHHGRVPSSARSPIRIFGAARL